MAAKLVQRKRKESERSPSDVPRYIHPAQRSYAYWSRRICLVSGFFPQANSKIVGTNQILG